MASSFFVEMIQCAVVIPASMIFWIAFLVDSRFSCWVGGGILLQIRSVAFPWRMPVGVFVCGFLLIVPFFGLGVFCVMLAFLRALVFVVHVRPSWW